MDWNVSPERLARLKSSVPKGKITHARLDPVKGKVIAPLSPEELGLPARKVA
jgi:hypothetical protein